MKKLMPKKHVLENLLIPFTHLPVTVDQEAPFTPKDDVQESNR